LTLVYLFHRQIRPHLPAPGKMPPVSVPVITPPTAAELEAQLKLAYEHQITSASQQLGVDLKSTSERLSQQVENLTTKVIEEELGSYKQTLEEVRKVATETMEQIHQAVETQRTELHASMEQELAQERKRLVAQFDTRLGDIVASYVAESLGGGVDLGSQLQYITQTLEANKEALKKDLLSGL
jgi:F0F1-type ATP synthase membrane subunit b/b'